MKREVYEIVTERIIARMEQGQIPWQRPWDGRIGLPRNVAGRTYRGINVWILGSAGFESPLWLTYKQAAELGGHVKQGEKATPVIFWKMLQRDRESADGSIEQRVFPMMRYYSVFNLEQCEGLPIQPNQPNILAERNPIEAAEKVLDAMLDKPRIHESLHDASNPPHYSGHLDVIEMPLKGQFKSMEHYYTTLFHELGHSTGIEARLNRKCFAQYGCVEGARNQEELVAEFTSGYLTAHCGILSEDAIENKAAYIQSWLRTIKDDRKVLIVAAAQAQKAADFILGSKEQTELKVAA